MSSFPQSSGEGTTASPEASSDGAPEIDASAHESASAGEPEVGGEASQPETASESKAPGNFDKGLANLQNKFAEYQRAQDQRFEQLLQVLQTRAPEQARQPEKPIDLDFSQYNDDDSVTVAGVKRLQQLYDQRIKALESQLNEKVQRFEQTTTAQEAEKVRQDFKAAAPGVSDEEFHAEVARIRNELDTYGPMSQEARGRLGYKMLMDVAKAKSAGAPKPAPKPVMASVSSPKSGGQRPTGTGNKKPSNLDEIMEFHVQKLQQMNNSAQ